MSSQALAAGLASFGTSMGQGFQNYTAGRERRELLSGEAQAIYGELQDKPNKTAADEKMLKKLEAAGDMGTRELQGIISEYDTGEKMDRMKLQKRLLQQQTESAERKGTSEQGLMDYYKAMPSLEEGFEGDAWAVPEYLTRDYLEGGRGQMDIAAGAFPSKHYGDESKAIYENVSTIPEGETRAAKHWMDKFKATGASHGEPSPDNAELRDAAIERNKARMAELEESIAGYDSRRDIQAEKYQRNFENEAPWLAKQIVGDPYKYKANDLPWPVVKWGDQGDHQWVGEGMKALEAQNYKDKEELGNLKVENEVLGMEGDSLEAAAEAKSPAVRDSEEPQYFEPKLKGYETYGDTDIASQQPLERYAATGGTPDTPMDERRGQLVDSLAQYGLTPEDRKKAIDMISEKYPKLKEIATGVESPDGKALGFKVGNTFIPARQSVGSAGAGGDDLELTSVTINDKGEVTRIMKPKEGLKESQKTLLANAKEFKHQAKKLLETVNSHGGWESSLSAAFSNSSAKAKADLDSLSYRMAILYSKIVDPATAAREGEVVAAKKYAFPMGFWTPNEVTRAAVDSMLEEVMRRESNFYEQEGMENPQAQESGGATNSNPLAYSEADFQK